HRVRDVRLPEGRGARTRPACRTPCDPPDLHRVVYDISTSPSLSRSTADVGRGCSSGGPTERPPRGAIDGTSLAGSEPGDLDERHRLSQTDRRREALVGEPLVQQITGHAGENVVGAPSTGASLDRHGLDPSGFDDLEPYASAEDLVDACDDRA